MFKTIIVGTDGSPTAQYAVMQAVELAQLSGAVLHIATAGDDVMSNAVGTFVPTGGAIVPNRLADDLASTVSEAAGEAREKGVSVETHVLRGYATEALCGLAERLDADLIVVGNRGMKGVQRFFFDSVPNAVSHQAPCSVLIVDTTGRE